MKSLKQNPLGRIYTWIKLHRRATIIFFGIGLLLIAAIWAAVTSIKSPEPPKTITPILVSPTPPPVIYYSPLTGVKVPDQASTQQAVTGIMIENSPDARPQSGIKSAGVVFEAIAEGGITRFLALYQEAKPRLIGPVRSLRLYYVDWLAPFQASAAHIGGSKFALNEIRNGNYRDIDQFFNAASYWRATDRYAPHNVYTNFERLDALNQKKGYMTSVFTSWPRKEGKSAKEPSARIIDVKISSSAYNSHYEYDSATNTYKRSQGGAPHNDREEGQVTLVSVIVMETTMVRVMEDGWREQITTIGSEKAYIFQDGIVTEATWSKKDRGSQLTFTTQDGVEVPLNRGQTWITAIPTNKGGSVSWR